MYDTFLQRFLIYFAPLQVIGYSYTFFSICFVLWIIFRRAATRDFCILLFFYAVSFPQNFPFLLLHELKSHDEHNISGQGTPFEYQITEGESFFKNPRIPHCHMCFRTHHPVFRNPNIGADMVTELAVNLETADVESTCKDGTASGFYRGYRNIRIEFVPKIPESFWYKGNTEVVIIQSGTDAD